MPKVYNVFISHSWNYANQYERLIEFLNEDPYFHYKDYSVPKDDPIHNAPNEKLLYEAIKRQISLSNIVIILAGVYATYSKWIENEIKISKNEFYFEKPILAIELYGSQRTSNMVKENANLTVSWNRNSIISGIRQIAS